MSLDSFIRKIKIASVDKLGLVNYSISAWGLGLALSDGKIDTSDTSYLLASVVCAAFGGLASDFNLRHYKIIAGECERDGFGKILNSEKSKRSRLLIKYYAQESGRMEEYNKALRRYQQL